MKDKDEGRNCQRLRRLKSRDNWQSMWLVVGSAGQSSKEQLAKREGACGLGTGCQQFLDLGGRMVARHMKSALVFRKYSGTFRDAAGNMVPK